MKNRFLKAIISAAIAACIMTLSGCFPTGEKDPVVSNDYSDKDIFEYKGENISVSFDIPETPDNVPTRIKLKEKSFDANEMIELFLEGKTIVEEESDRDFGLYWTADGTYLGVNDGSNWLSFFEGSVCRNGLGVSEGEPINHYIDLFHSREHFREIFGIGEEIEGFPSQVAIDQALELCSKLGINNLGEPSVYAFDLGVYEKYTFNSPFLDPDVPFTKDNEVYILHFPQTFGGVGLADFYDTTVNDSTAQYGKSSVDSPEVVVGVSRTGIFHFDVDEAYEAEYEIVSGEPIKYDINYALSELSAYFERSYFKDETKFTAARIAYFPVERKEKGYIEYSLAWFFLGSTYDKKFDRRYMDSYDIVFLTDSGARIDYNY